MVEKIWQSWISSWINHLLSVFQDYETIFFWGGGRNGRVRNSGSSLTSSLLFLKPIGGGTGIMRVWEAWCQTQCQVWLCHFLYSRSLVCFCLLHGDEQMHAIYLRTQRVSSLQSFRHQGQVLWKTVFLLTGSEGMISGWFKHITFTVFFISIIITSTPPQIIRP